MLMLRNIQEVSARAQNSARTCSPSQYLACLSLRRYKTSYNNLAEVQSLYRGGLNALNIDITNSQHDFKRHQSSAAILARDYLTLRMSILSELIDVTEHAHEKTTLRRQLVRVAADFRRFVDRAIKASIDAKVGRIYSERHLVRKRGCHTRVTPEGGMVCRCADGRDRWPSYCTEYRTFWYIPGETVQV